MAKTTQYIRSLATTWKEDYKRDTKYWNNKDEYEKVGELMDRFEKMRHAVHSNCYWGTDGGMHKSWHDHADYLTKIVNMWHAAVDETDPRPNLKSPFAYNATETAMNEMYDLNLMPGVNPWTEKAIKKAAAIENIISYPINRFDINYTWLDAMQEALWIGNAFLDVNYTKVVRKVKMKKLKGFTKEELKKLKDGEPAIYEEKDFIEYNDVNWTHIPFHEYYPDPSARKQHGINHAANDGIWERTLSYDAFMGEFDRRGFKNIDKVKGSTGETREDNPLFKLPENLEDDTVVVLRWQVKSRDLERFVANGVWIGDFPLPNHKQLSVVHMGCIKLPHQYYYMGLADVIEGLQTEDEVVRNQFLELLEIALKPPIIANNIVAGEFAEQYENARYNAGEIISISGSPSEIQWFTPAVTRLAEVLNLRTQIRDDVISVSLIDPKASAMPTNTPTAFEAMQTTAATMKSFMKTLKSFSRCIKKGLELQWELQRQEYPLCLEPEDIQERQGESATKPRTIYIPDIEIIDGKDGTLDVINKPGKKFPLKMKDEYFDISAQTDMDIIIKPESMIPLSKISKVKKSEEAMTQLFPIYAQDAAMKGIPPLDYEPIKLLIKNYVLSHDIDTDILDRDDEDEDESIERATKQHEIMLKNAKLPIGSDKYKPVMGIFGEPLGHTNEHLRVMVGYQTLLDKRQTAYDGKLAMAADEIKNGQQPTTQLIEEAAKLKTEIEEIQKFLGELKIHLEMDKMTEAQGMEMALSKQAGMPAGQTPINMNSMQPMPGQPMPPQAGMGGGQIMPPQQGGMMAPPTIPGTTPTSPMDMQMMQM